MIARQPNMSHTVKTPEAAPQATITTTPRRFVCTLAAAAVLLGSAAPARAALVVDTGVPNGNAIGAYAFDGTDFYAGQVTFTNAAQIGSIATHVLGGSAGETFTVVLYADGGSHLPGAALFQATATFDTDGWNGVFGLSGWDVTAGAYWVAFEINFGDDLGSGSATGALLDRGVPAPLSRTAFDAGSGYQPGAMPLDFGVRVEAVAAAVPEPGVSLLMLAGLGAIGWVARRRRG